MNVFRSAALLLVTLLLIPAARAEPARSETLVFGMGCFWGAEKRFSALPGVTDVESGYAGGDSATVTYDDLFEHERLRKKGKGQGRNHAEVIKVSFDPERTNARTLLIAFWENHDPTQGDRQGNDVGSNYRSAIYYTNDAQKTLAFETREVYQAALHKAGYPAITTEIAPLRHYNRAEAYHQDYLKRNPDGYCGLGGTGVSYPDPAGSKAAAPLSAADLDFTRQLIVFEAETCPFCKQFRAEILDHWRSPVPIVTTLNPRPPAGWTLEKALFATPTIVLFEKGRELSRYTGYNGDESRFWKWLGFQLLTPEQRKIAFERDTEIPFTGSHLDEKRAGTFVDPITGAPLFRTDGKFDSGSGWPSFFKPLDGAITLHEDSSHGMKRVEVRSASSGIHLGHVFDDGPPPTHKRYCINGNVLRFVPDGR